MVKRTSLLTKYLWLVFLVIGLAGVILVFLSTLLPAQEPWAVALFGLGISLMSSSLVSFMNAAFGIDIPTLVEQKLALHHVVYDTGIAAVHLGVGDDKIFEHFAQAHRIDLMYASGRDTVFRHATKLRQTIIANRCRLRVLLVDPNAHFWNDPVVVNSLCPGFNVKGEVEDVLSRLRVIVDEVKSEMHARNIAVVGSIEVRLYGNPPTCSIVTVNGQLARHTPYLPYKNSSEVPIYEVVASLTGLLPHYQAAFDRVWERSSGRIILKEEFNLAS